MNDDMGQLIDRVLAIMTRSNRFTAVSEEARRDYVTYFAERGQIILGTAKKGEEAHHFGFILWDQLAADSEKVLIDEARDPLEVGPDSLPEGDEIWVLDMICPKEQARAFLDTAIASHFRDDRVFIRALDNAGQPKLVTYPE